MGLFNHLRPLGRRIQHNYAPQLRALSSSGSLNVSGIEITKTTSPKPLPNLDGIGFGSKFSDHMLEIDWSKTSGWETPKISEYHNFEMSPAASCLHYGLQCFEGMKCYKDAQGNARLFRPDMNMARLNNSMARLSMPSIDEKDLLECIKQLIRIDQNWIPDREGYSLYIRPTAISTHPFIGVTAPEHTKVFTILSPVGPYYPEGFKPVKLFADNENRRAWPGGTGNVKIGGNYAPTIAVSNEVIKKGFSQILWLFGDNDLVTEVGTMNLLFLWEKEDGSGNELVTAPLDGTILPGVTRDSILSLCKEWGEFDVVERDIPIAEVVDKVKSGRMIESFGCGTAAVVSPVESIHYKGETHNIPLKADGKSGELTKRIWDTLLDIQYGRVEHPWSVVV